MKPEKDYLVAFAGIDQLWSIHAEVQPTEIGNTSDANCEERSKQESPVIGQGQGN